MLYFSKDGNDHPWWSGELCNLQHHSIRPRKLKGHWCPHWIIEAPDSFAYISSESFQSFASTWHANPWERCRWGYGQWGSKLSAPIETCHFFFAATLIDPQFVNWCHGVKCKACQIPKLHKHIYQDHDLKITLKFWNSFWKMSGVTRLWRLTSCGPNATSEKSHM